MSRVYPLAFFCEDIREELQGTHSLVGLLPDNIEVPGFPSGISNLALYLRVNFSPTDQEPDSVDVFMDRGTEGRLLMSSLDPALFKKARQEALEKESPLAGVISKIRFGPLEFGEPGRITIVVKTSDEEIPCATLRIHGPET